MITKKSVYAVAGMLIASLVLSATGQTNAPALKLQGNRFLTFSTLVRVNQIETSRDKVHGQDEASVHGPEEARIFRDAVEKGWPGARITWGFSWLALKDQRTNYLELKKLVVSYHEKYGDEITFVPGGYFANMYNTREQVNRDLHEGLQMVSEMVGGGYRPKCVIAGFLAADNLRYLAEKENIHVCQGNIWSQYAVDNGDGEGSICYPYYPSREHFCKPAQGKADLIDCINLDGWTVDFLCARIPGGRTVNGERWRSRQGVGPIETLLDMGTERGLQAMLATTATHFDTGFERNGFGWVTSIWELGLVEGRKLYGYKGRNGIDGLVSWLTEMRRRWPEAKCITHGEFGLLWREQFKDNEHLDYRFVQRGCGIRASESDKEISWFMNKDFRLAILRDWKKNELGKVIDFTRYDLPAAEPLDPEPDKASRNWSLLNRLNQKGVRPQDQSVPIQQLTSEEQALIKRRYPELIKSKPNIILIMADDLGYAALGCYGQKLIQTPEIDKLATTGMRFTDFYAANTVCVPSRVSMLMGLHPGHAPIRDNLLPHLPGFLGYMEAYPRELWPPKLPTLGQVMKKAGYITAQFGKLEAGIPMQKGMMREHGWDYWFGFKGTGDAFQYYPLTLWKNDELVTFNENRHDDVRRQGIVGKRGTYSEDLFVSEILNFIKSNKDNPFFVYFPTQIPHGRSPKDGDEMQVPDIGPYADKEWTHQEKLYAAALTRLDSDVGRIVQELKAQGITQKTMIFFTSDNGDENSYYKYTNRFQANGQLKGKKRFLYEGGIRVPLLASWPGQIQPGQTSHIPAAGWDIMATLADLAGAEPPAHADGISLVPTLLGQPERQQAREYLYWEYHQGKQQAVRLGSWKGIRFGGTQEPIELYDLASDIGETHNVASEHPEIVARLRAIMEEARAGSEFNAFWPLPEHRQNQIKLDKAIFDQLVNGIR